MESFMKAVIDCCLLQLKLLKFWKSTPVMLGSKLLPISAHNQRTTVLKIATHLNGPKSTLEREVQNHHSCDFPRSWYQAGFLTFHSQTNHHTPSPVSLVHLFDLVRETGKTCFQGCLSQVRPYSLLKQGRQSLLKYNNCVLTGVYSSSLPVVQLEVYTLYLPLVPSSAHTAMSLQNSSCSVLTFATSWTAFTMS